MKIGLKYGLIYGAVTIVTLLAYYLINPAGLFDLGWIRTIFGFAIMGVIMFLAARAARTEKGGFINFGEAFIPSIITYLLGGFIGIIFMHILMNFIDPSLQELANEMALETQRKVLEMMGQSEDQIMEAMERAEKQQGEIDGFGIFPMILSFLGNSLIIGLPIAAIVAAIVKKNPPTSV